MRALMVLGILAAFIPTGWADAQDIQGYNRLQRYDGQTVNHYMKTQRLYREVFSKDSEDRCSDACCQAKAGVQFLQGLHYMMEALGGRETTLAQLQGHHDRLMGRLIFTKGLKSLRGRYIGALRDIGSEEGESMDEAVAVMEQAILVDALIEQVVDEGNADFIEERIREYAREGRGGLEEVARGFSRAYKAQGERKKNDVSQLFEDYKLYFNRGLPSGLAEAEAKRGLLVRWQEGELDEVPKPNGLEMPPDTEEEESLRILQDLEDVKSRIGGITAQKYYSIVRGAKQEHLSELYSACGFSEEEDRAPSCRSIEERERSLANTNGFANSSTFVKEVFGKFLNIYKETIGLKNRKLVENLVLSDKPEFFSQKDGDFECHDYLCAGYNPYFNPFFNNVGGDIFKGCPSLESADTSIELDRGMASLASTEGDGGLAQEEKRLKEALTCALGDIYPPPPPAMRMMRTLNFLSSSLTKKLREYGFGSDREKAQFFAQLIHESAGFSSTVERTGNALWKGVLRSDAQEWNCSGYLDAINRDKDYFDHNYRHSKDRYKATYRGRGLVQLTGCRNYLSFFYHKAALEADRSDLAWKDKKFFTEDEWGDMRDIDWAYCDHNTLKNVAQQFAADGLVLDQALVNNFEGTVNNLALPCEDKGAGFMSSEEFLVDSSIWFWKKNCMDEYDESINWTPDKAVGRITKCVHGAVALYDTFDASFCNADGSPKEGHLGRLHQDKRWYLRSYCHRLKSFSVLDKCFNPASQ